MAKKKKSQSKWIQKSAKKMKEKGTAGSLREALGVKQGKSIPAAKLAEALKSDDPAVRKKANWAKNVKKSRK
jgi:hypothetical protein